MNTEQIWQEYSASLKAFLRTKVSDPDEVEDLLQDNLLRTHTNLHTIKYVKKVKPWLFTTANNAIIDFYRRNSYQTKSAADLSQYSNDDTPHPFFRCLTPFIQSLPDEYAELLTQIDLNNIPQKQYAALNGINYSTLKSKVQKARMALRSLFESCCELTLDHKGNVLDYTPKAKACKGC